MDDWSFLVESTVDAIQIGAANKRVSIEITCPWEGQGRKKIVATGVDDFYVNDLRLSNIIDTVHRFTGPGAQEAALNNDLFFMMRGIHPSPSDLEWAPLKEKVRMVQAGTLELLVINPVYGATIMLLAREVRLGNR